MSDFMKDKVFVALSSVFFILFAVGLGVTFLNTPTSNILKAKNAVPSPLKSFAVIFPQVGIAGTPDSEKPPTRIKVSVFMRDINGNVLADRNVKLSSEPSVLTINPSDTLFTNNIGQAEFFITASEKGKVSLLITDVGSNTQLANVPSVEFVQ